jgi:hypothetical protein
VAAGAAVVEVAADDDVGVDFAGDPRVLRAAVGEHHAIVDRQVGERLAGGGDGVAEVDGVDGPADVVGLGVGDADDADPDAVAFDDRRVGHVVDARAGRVRTAVGRGDAVGPLGGPFGSGVEVVVAERVGGGADPLEEGQRLGASRVGQERERPEGGVVAGADDERAVVASAREAGGKRPDAVGVVVGALQVGIGEQSERGVLPVSRLVAPRERVVVHGRGCRVLPDATVLARSGTGTRINVRRSLASVYFGEFIGIASANSVKAPTRSTRGPRCAPRLTAFGCGPYVGRRRRTGRPFQSRPTWTSEAGGTERGHSLREPGRCKHRSERSKRGAQRVPGPQRVGAFTLFEEVDSASLLQ